MRVAINLATQPYQDLRRFLVRWGLGVAVMALVTCMLMYAAIIQLIDWRTDSRQIAEVRARIAAYDGERAKVEALLSKPGNRDTRDRSRFINQLITQKEFSWTQVFSDLEKLMPPRLHVSSLRPGMNASNQLELRMKVAGSSRAGAIELVRRLEQSPHFTHARVDSESLVTAASNPTAASNTPESVQFEISAVYIPSASREAANGRR